jgi:hypothetical protein
MVAVFLAVSLNTLAQESSPKPTISDAPLTTEQIAVYRAVLSEYTKGSATVLNLANITEPLDGSDVTCLIGFYIAVKKQTPPLIHRIGPALIVNMKIALVDPERQHQAVRDNDPDNLIRKATDDHQKITDEQLDKSLKSAFDSGLFTLSEIAFDKDHHRAAVSYNFLCGRLCGNGHTLTLRKVANHWQVTRRCGGWIS